MEDYIRLAALQGCIPQDFAAFRRFLALQALRLLRQQNQIARLRLALGRHATAGRQGTEPGTVLSGLALDPSQDLSENEKKQLQLWDELDAKLAVYGKAGFHPGFFPLPLHEYTYFSALISVAAVSTLLLHHSDRVVRG